MDVALADLDNTLLAARWVRAVAVADVALVAACETEADDRGYTCRGLVAATTKETRDQNLARYQELAKQAAKDSREGNFRIGKADSKDKKKKGGGSGKGFNPNRKGKGTGGGQFTTADDSQANKDAAVDQAKAETKAETDAKKELAAKKRAVAERRKAEDEAERRAQFDEEEANRRADADERAATQARRESRAAKRAVEAAEDEDLATRIKANTDYEAARKGEVTLMTRQLAEARQLGNDADEIKLTAAIAAAKADIDKTKADRRALDAEKAQKTATRAQSRAQETADEQKAATTSSEQRRAREAAQRVARETSRRSKAESRTAEDASLQAEAEELDRRIEAARVRERAAAEAAKAKPKPAAPAPTAKPSAAKPKAAGSDVIPFNRATMKSYENGVWRDANGKVVGYADEEDAPIHRTKPKPKSRTAALLAGFAPDLHPRGKDGKFIETFGFVDISGLHGFQHGQRGAKDVQGQVVEIIPDAKKPGDPIIRVKVTDPRWDPAKFGETVDVRRSQVAQRVGPKATLTKSPVPNLKPTGKTVQADPGIIPPRAPTPAMTASPDGPNMTPIEPPDDWATMAPAARLAFVTDRMEADYLAWRGEPTEFDYTGMDSGIALNLANTYRELTNWDPDTARRLDRPMLPSSGGNNGLKPNAIAVAHPGTQHVGGIGPKIKPSAIVFGVKYTSSMGFWQKQQALSASSKMPWSTSSMTGDPTVTLIHEFAHQKQFRYLDTAMSNANRVWGDAVLDDGFGAVPDSSNWAETQELRYLIPKLSQTKYGQSKSSEGFAEAWAERMLGISSPELNETLDQWNALMAISDELPKGSNPSARSWDQLTESEKDQFWEANGQYLSLPGMAAHYPESAAAYDQWVAAKQIPPAPAVVP